MSYAELEDVLFAEDVELAEYDYCLRHASQCKRLFNPNDSTSKRTLKLKVAGSSCTDFSLMGKQMKESGPAAPAFVTLNLYLLLEQWLFFCLNCN